MRELVTTNPRSRSSTKLVTAPGAVPAALHFEVLKKLRLVQLISRGAVLPLPKYAHSSLSRILKNPVYNELINTYPQNTERLHKEKQMFSSDRNVGLVTQAIDRAPPWTLKKPMATYVTLGLSDIVRVVGIQSEDEVRALGLSMIETGDISAQISTSSTVTFSDRPPQISKDEVDTAVPRRYRGTRGPIHASYTTRPTAMGLPHALDPANGTNVDLMGSAISRKALSASVAASAMHSIVAAGIQAQLLSNWTASPSIGQMELIFNGSSSISRASAHRVLGVICAVASIPRHECCRVPHAIPPPPDPRTAAADVAQVQAQVEAQVQAQAQSAADRSARDERGRPRVVAHLSIVVV
ncbi:hypothetical protein B0H14DRAFT_3138174 [Mycena olivaceomarginata]|nr:hypothetical protein B0H14DRAFT_3138174 [Mycena olivaceomarginata]